MRMSRKTGNKIFSAKERKRSRKRGAGRRTKIFAISTLLMITVYAVFIFHKKDRFARMNGVCFNRSAPITPLFHANRSDIKAGKVGLA